MRCSLSQRESFQTPVGLKRLRGAASTSVTGVPVGQLRVPHGGVRRGDVVAHHLLQRGHLSGVHVRRTLRHAAEAGRLEGADQRRVVVHVNHLQGEAVLLLIRAQGVAHGVAQAAVFAKVQGKVHGKDTRRENGAGKQK